MFTLERMGTEYEAKNPEPARQTRYANHERYVPDVCPPIDSPEFLKRFPLEDCDFKRILAARMHGYGD